MHLLVSELHILRFKHDILVLGCCLEISDCHNAYTLVVIDEMKVNLLVNKYRNQKAYLFNKFAVFYFLVEQLT